MTASSRTGILFICMGNICRSPLAEGVFIHRSNRRGVADRFRVDSAGTGGWHEGDLPDPRSRAVAEANGIVLPSRARPVRPADFTRYEHLIVMDLENRRWMLANGAPAERVRLLLEFDADAPVREVPDPYYGGRDGFDEVFQLVDSACAALLDHLLNDRP
jgi:protein-tyrosine phosphatase